MYDISSLRVKSPANMVVHVVIDCMEQNRERGEKIFVNNDVFFFFVTIKLSAVTFTQGTFKSG